MDDLPLIPGYSISRLLGQGGMSRVYLARDKKLDRQVAVKVLLPSLAEDMRTTSRFMHEAKIAARIQHSNIVSIYDVGCHGRWHYMVMELLFDSLKEKIAGIDTNPLMPFPGLTILETIARALEYSHKLGFVHRDVKPDNIMFRVDQTPVLADFGISRCVYANSRLTRTGMSIGTPHYMSPEQIKGEPTDGRSDFYSLGIVLYEMIHGKVPFTATEAISVAMKHIRDPIPILQENNRIYQHLLNRMLAKEAEQRLSGSDELADILREIKDRLSQENQNCQQGTDLTLTQINPVHKKKPRKKRMLLIFSVIAAVSVLLFFFYFREKDRAAEIRKNPVAVAKKSENELTGNTVVTNNPPQQLAEPEQAPVMVHIKQANEKMRVFRFSEAEALLKKADRSEKSLSDEGKAADIRKQISRIKNLRTVTLRSRYRKIGENDVRDRILSLNFRDRSWNSQGNFANNLRKLKCLSAWIIIDYSSGLMWHATASNKKMKYSATGKWIADLNGKRSAGFADWRLPTIEEAASLLEHIKNNAGFFVNSRFSHIPKRIWTGDDFSPGGHWFVDFSKGSINWNLLGFSRCSILPVRSLY